MAEDGQPCDHVARWARETKRLHRAGEALRAFQLALAGTRIDGASPGAEATATVDGEGQLVSVRFADDAPLELTADELARSVLDALLAAQHLLSGRIEALATEFALPPEVAGPIVARYRSRFGVSSR